MPKIQPKITSQQFSDLRGYYQMKFCLLAAKESPYQDMVSM